jgi:hypothetical protein
MAGTAVISAQQITVLNNIQRKVLSIAVVAGDDGVFTNSTINATTYGLAGWFLHSVEAVLGDPAPTPGFDIEIKDANSIDLLGEQMKLMPSWGRIQHLSDHGIPMCRGNLTLSLTGMGVTGAALTLILIFVPE